jgi:hypothetical protein
VTGGYTFDDIHVSLQPGHPEVAEIRFVPGWAGEEYPGEKACTWTVYDEQGNVTGQQATGIVGMQAHYEDPVQTEIPVDGGVASARIACESERLDDGDGRFEISNVRLRPTQRDGALFVEFAREWLGAGQPAPQMCYIQVLDAEHQVLIAREGGMKTSARGTSEGRFIMEMAPEMRERAATATVSCTPL